MSKIKKNWLIRAKYMHTGMLQTLVILTMHEYFHQSLFCLSSFFVVVERYSPIVYWLIDVVFIGFFYYPFLFYNRNIAHKNAIVTDMQQRVKKRRISSCLSVSGYFIIFPSLSVLFTHDVYESPQVFQYKRKLTKGNLSIGSFRSRQILPKHRRAIR